MSFSQSFLFGDETLERLDVCEPVSEQPQSTTPNKNANDTKVKPLYMPPPSDVASPDHRETNAKNIDLDVIDESPTDKRDMTLGRSIRERLKYATTSKKRQRKHMRRSKSDPLSIDEASLVSSVDRTHAKSNTVPENHGTLLDSSDEWMVAAVSVNRSHKSKSKLCDRFSSGMDEMDSFFKNVDTQPNANASKELIAISSSDEDQVAIDRMLNDMDGTSNATFTLNLQPKEPAIPANDVKSCDESIQWEDSAFFQNFNETIGDLEPPAANGLNDNVQAETNLDVLVDGDCNLSVQHVDRVADDELESRYLEVSLELSKLNETNQLSQLTPQLMHSMSRRPSISGMQPFAESSAPNVSAKPKSQSCTRDINSLAQWGCTPAIIREYLKRGIQTMFDWQVECLSKHEVSSIFSCIVAYLKVELV